ncbi:MAG: hypothetical protein KGK07_15430 [Chloroflexota bacterium]|nr:hypothetical protein [Chloroflexota bacterium]
MHVTGWERWPDLVREVTTAEPIDAQIRALDRSGIVGRLDAARYDFGAAGQRQTGSVAEWIVKTHAGSAAERRAWLLSA